MYIAVKINSKYKEDDFSDSNTVDLSLDVCVLKIYFLHIVSACQTPLLLPPPLLQIPAQAVSYENSRH